MPAGPCMVLLGCSRRQAQCFCNVLLQWLGPTQVKFMPALPVGASCHLASLALG